MRKLAFLVLFIVLGSTHVHAEKKLYFYSDINDTAKSNTVRSVVIASGIPYTELVLGRDARIHSTATPGIVVVVAVDGAVQYEFVPVMSAEITAAYAAASSTLPPNTPAVVSPLITKAQATATLKSLLETNPTAWTAAQERQAMYLLLLYAFKDFQNGNVY